MRRATSLVEAAVVRSCLVRICAWCGSIAIGDRWFPGGFVSSDLPATHGMCPTCLAKAIPSTAPAGAPLEDDADRRG